MRFDWWRVRGGLLLAFWVLGAAAHAGVLATATPGVTLTLSSTLSDTPMAVAYIPAFQRYYGGSGGGTASPETVFSSAGTQLGRSSTGVDDRGLYFNPNTGALEAVSFNACCASGPVTGIQRIDLDGSGNLLGTNAQLLAGPIAALANFQTMPSYDSAANRLYAKQVSSGNVNVVDRTTGAAVTTIVLNLAAAGVTSGDINSNFIGFTGVAGSELAVYDFTNHRALVFDLAGNFIGASVLPAIAGTFNNQSFGSGYANGQFFVFDDSFGSFGGWRGFVIFGKPPLPATPVPAVTASGLGILGSILAIVAMIALCRRVRT